MNKKPLLVIGAGGHAKILIAILQSTGRKILGIVEADESKHEQSLLGVSVIGNDEIIFKYKPKDIELINAVGSIGKITTKHKVYERFKMEGYHFASLIHPSAVILDGVELAEGVHVLPSVVIQPGSKIESNTLINTGSIIGHDCIIGSSVHIAPRSTLSGDVKIGDRTHIGTGATILQGIQIGSDCTVGAGSLIVRDVSNGTKTIAAPAKSIRI